MILFTLQSIINLLSCLFSACFNFLVRSLIRRYRSNRSPNVQSCFGYFGYWLDRRIFKSFYSSKILYFFTNQQTGRSDTSAKRHKRPRSWDKSVSNIYSRSTLSKFQTLTKFLIENRLSY